MRIFRRECVNCRLTQFSIGSHLNLTRVGPSLSVPLLNQLGLNLSCRHGTRHCNRHNRRKEVQMKRWNTSRLFLMASVMLLHTSLPVAMAMLPPPATGELYVSSFGTGDEIVVYAPDGKYLRNFDVPGLVNPRGIVFLEDGGFLVSSQATDNIMRFDANDNHVSSFGNALLDAPTGLTLSENGEVYVCGYNSDNVVVFNLAGDYLRHFSHPDLNGPNCVAFDSQGNGYVSSALTNLILKFDAGDQFQFSFTGGGLSSPMGIARTPDDVLYVAGGASDDIVKFDTDGNYLGEFGHPQLDGPQGVAFDERGHLFSSSFYADVIVEFDENEQYVQTITAGNLDIPRSIAFRPGVPAGEPIPAASTWGMVSMVLAIMTAATLLFGFSDNTPRGYRTRATLLPENFIFSVYN